MKNVPSPRWQPKFSKPQNLIIIDVVVLVPKATSCGKFFLAVAKLSTRPDCQMGCCELSLFQC